MNLTFQWGVNPQHLGLQIQGALQEQLACKNDSGIGLQGQGLHCVLSSGLCLS